MKTFVIFFFIIFSISLMASHMRIIPSSLRNMNFYVMADDGTECIDVQFKSVDVKKGKKALFLKINPVRSFLINDLNIKIFSNKISQNKIEELNERLFTLPLEVNNFSMNFISKQENIVVSAKFAKTLSSKEIFALQLTDINIKSSKKNIIMPSAILIFSNEKVHLESNKEIFEILKFKN